MVFFTLHTTTSEIFTEKKYISVALEFYFKSDLFDQLKNINHKTTLAIGEVYFELKDYEKALEYFDLELIKKKDLDNKEEFQLH